MIRAFFIACVLGLAFFWMSTSRADNAIVVHSTKQRTVEQKAAAELETLNKNIDALRVKSQQAGQSTREHVDTALAVLEKEVTEAGNALDKLRSSTDDSWENIHKNFNAKMTEAHHLYRKTAQDVKKSTGQSN